MTDVCTRCVAAPHFDQAAAVRAVRSNVRQFQHECFTVWRCPACRSLHSREKAIIGPDPGFIQPAQALYIPHTF